MFNFIFKTDIHQRNISLPIGISFFTFQILSYVIDVYRKKIDCQKNIFSLALYISLFPQLIAGPIVKYSEIKPQLENRKVSLDDVYSGVRRFMVGFSKKVLIADQLSPLVDVAFSNKYPSVLVNWIGMIAYTLQIYFDFSGYSDMAIGIGKSIGFDFPENFDYPYISSSIQEFWRRWHITLGNWFKEYLYIPLGGNRKGEYRTYLYLFIVFIMTGVWHGASYNFITWGIYHGVFQLFERTKLAEYYKSKAPLLIRRTITILIVMFGWVLFRMEGVMTTLSYYKNMFIPAGNDLIYLKLVMNRQYYFCILIGIIFSIPLNIIVNLNKNKAILLFKDACIIIIFLIAICYMVGSGFSPFLYFRF